MPRLNRELAASSIEMGKVSPAELATSGSDRHPILKPTERQDAAVEGTVFTISTADLAAADECEVDDYTRIAVPLRSGLQAWVYVFDA